MEALGRYQVSSILGRQKCGISHTNIVQSSIGRRMYFPFMEKKEPVYEMEANDLPFFHLCASHFEFPCHRHSYFTLVWKEHPFVHILNSTLAKKLRNFFPFPLGTMRVLPGLQKGGLSFPFSQTTVTEGSRPFTL